MNRSTRFPKIPSYLLTCCSSSIGGAEDMFSFARLKSYEQGSGGLAHVQTHFDVRHA